MHPSDSDISSSKYTLQFYERKGEWIWIEWEVIINGDNTVNIYTYDGELAGEYANAFSELPVKVTIDGFNELAYWEGA